jgi:predicted patatin/cPLA2 family phospholipase
VATDYLKAIKEKFFGPSFPKKKVLVLEGGGMRGVFLTGVLQSFSDRGYFPWKMVIGSSSGAMIGVSYASNQIHIARDAYFDKLLKGNFIQLRNILKQKRHIINIDWFVDSVMEGDEAIDVKKLRKKCPVLITVTDCREYRPPETVYLNSKYDDVRISLKATAAIPYLYRGFVNYKNLNLLDGGVLDPVPYRKALSMGFKEKDILVVLTREKGYRKKKESFWIKALYENYYRDREYHPLVAALENRYLKYNSILDDLEEKHTGIDVIYPPHEFKVDRLTKDEKRILDGFEFGIRAGIDFLKSKTWKKTAE